MDVMFISWIYKNVIKGFNNIIDKKNAKLKKLRKRNDYFVYTGITDKTGVSSINFLKDDKDISNLTILFSAFNDRYNLFTPISSYNLNSPKRQNSKDSGDKKYVEKYHSFHSERIIPFSFKDEKNNYQDKKEFLTLLTGERRLIYITGSVGCGKSTFISHLIYFARQEIQQNKNITVISLSAKKLDKIDNDESSIYKLIEKSFHEDFKQVEIRDRASFKSVVDKHFKHHKLTIIIDDLDQIYDESRTLILQTTKYSAEFKKHFKNKKYIHIAVKLFSVIKDLLDDNNVNFVIGLRDETFEAINTKYIKETGSESLKKLRNHLRISIEHLDIKKILEKRLPVEYPNEKRENSITYFFTFANEFANEFDGLHINGTRHVMSQLRKLSEIDANQLFYKKWMLQLYIYLDGLQKYSQQACGILNIFLVNIDYRKKLDEYHDKYPKFTKADHYQTFWLKYFICKYFDKEIGSRAVDASIVYEKFSKYERGIFNFSIYSLTDTGHGRLISCCFDENQESNDDYQLKKTERLEHCFSKKIFFNFVYLSVIVNDDYLEIPKIEQLEKIFNKKHVYDTNFFAKNDQKWKEWLFEHITKVLVFVKILESSLLYYEKNKISHLENLFPNFQEIKDDLVMEIKNIATTIGIGDDEITSKINESNKINKKISCQLEKHFTKYSSFSTKKEKADSKRPRYQE